MKNIQAVIAGVLFDFVGFLTSRPESFLVGSDAEVQPTMEALQEWARERGLSLDDACVQDWTERIAQIE